MEWGMRLLLVEDNDRLASLVKQGLEKVGYNTDVVTTATDALDAVEASHYDVVALDLGLPDEDGLTVLRALRRQGKSTPVIVLTARGSVRDRVAGLDAGADDYLVKPFALEELIARLNALMRRPANLLGHALRLGNLTFDTTARQVFVDDKACVLAAREIAILEALLRRSGRVVSKQLLESDLYGLSEDVGSNAVEVYVHRLRKRLVELGASVRIHTLRGLGYSIAEDAS
jgi:DNA-binding response OmpR family regulator